MCELNARALTGGPSLGLVKARRVNTPTITNHSGWTPEEQQMINNYVGQPELFDLGKPKSALEATRFKGTYHWRCLGEECKGQEFTAFQRRLPQDDEAAIASIRRRWFTEICSPGNDVYFYVGN